MRNHFQILHAILAALTLAACSSPAPLSQRNAVTDIVAVEHRFADAVAAQGTRDGFLQFAAPDAVQLRDRPVAAVNTLRAEPPDHIWLDWYPDHIAVSAAQDLAVSTGPYEARSQREGKRSDVGRFFSVWRRDESGEWKFLVDGGVDQGIAACAPCLPVGAERHPVPWASPDASALMNAKAGLANDVVSGDTAAESQFWAQAGASDLAGTLTAYRHDALLLRAKTGALTGSAAIQTALQDRMGLVVRSRRLAMSASGDLACWIGTNETADGKAKFDWVRIWVRNGSDWGILLDWEQTIAH